MDRRTQIRSAVSALTPIIAESHKLSTELQVLGDVEEGTRASELVEARVRATFARLESGLNNYVSATAWLARSRAEETTKADRRRRRRT